MAPADASWTPLLGLIVFAAVLTAIGAGLSALRRASRSPAPVTRADLWDLPAGSHPPDARGDRAPAPYRPVRGSLHSPGLPSIFGVGVDLADPPVGPEPTTLMLDTPPVPPPVPGIDRPDD